MSAKFDGSVVVDNMVSQLVTIFIEALGYTSYTPGYIHTGVKSHK